MSAFGGKADIATLGTELAAPGDPPVDDEPGFLRSWNSDASKHANPLKLAQRVAYRCSRDPNVPLEHVGIKYFGADTLSFAIA